MVYIEAVQYSKVLEFNEFNETGDRHAEVGGEGDAIWQLLHSCTSRQVEGKVPIFLQINLSGTSFYIFRLLFINHFALHNGREL